MNIAYARKLVAGFVFTLASLTAVHAADIYPEKPDAKPEIREALAKAKAEHKRVILDFGGNWCGDCKVLDIYFHQAPNDKLLADNFVLVDVNIGHYDMNLDVADKYGVPLKKGVPALAVLAPNGSLLYSQSTGEFENMRHMEASAVTDFLNQWKPKKEAARKTGNGAVTAAQ